MDKLALIIEMPELSNEVVGEIYHFLHTLIMAFESHYLSQLRQFHQDLPLDDDIEDTLDHLF